VGFGGGPAPAAPNCFTYALLAVHNANQVVGGLLAAWQEPLGSMLINAFRPFFVDAVQKMLASRAFSTTTTSAIRTGDVTRHHRR